MLKFCVLRYRKPNLFLHFILNQLYFWVGSAVCVGLYTRTMIFIKAHKTTRSGRLDTLSNVFAVLAAAWVFCEGPYIVSTLLEYPIWAHSGCNENYFQSCNLEYCAQLNNNLAVVDQITLMVKNFFPVVNTILLIILMRPLQQPILRCFKICGRRNGAP